MYVHVLCMYTCCIGTDVVHRFSGFVRVSVVPVYVDFFSMIMMMMMLMIMMSLLKCRCRAAVCILTRFTRSFLPYIYVYNQFMRFISFPVPVKEKRRFSQVNIQQSQSW